MRPYFPVGGVGLVALDFYGKTTPLSGTLVTTLLNKSNTSWKHESCNLRIEHKEFVYYVPLKIHISPEKWWLVQMIHFLLNLKWSLLGGHSLIFEKVFCGPRSKSCRLSFGTIAIKSLRRQQKYTPWDISMDRDGAPITSLPKFMEVCWASQNHLNREVCPEQKDP